MFNPLPNDKFLDLSKLKQIADDRYSKVHLKWKISVIKGRKHFEKRRNCLLHTFSPFLTMFSTAVISLVRQNTTNGTGSGWGIRIQINPIPELGVSRDPDLVQIEILQCQKKVNDLLKPWAESFGYFCRARSRWARHSCHRVTSVYARGWVCASGFFRTRTSIYTYMYRFQSNHNWHNCFPS